MTEEKTHGRDYECDLKNLDDTEKMTREGVLKVIDEVAKTCHDDELLRLAANVRADASFYQSTDLIGELFSHIVRFDYRKLAKLLIKESDGKILYSTQPHTTPLHISVTHNLLEMTRLLLRLEVRFGCKSRPKMAQSPTTKKMRPLHLAALNNNTEIITLLLNQPDNYTAPTSHGQADCSPLEIAVLQGNFEASEILLDAVLGDIPPDASLFERCRRLHEHQLYREVRHAASHGYLNMPHDMSRNTRNTMEHIRANSSACYNETCRHVDILRLIIKTGYDINTPVAMFYAIKAKSIGAVRMLLTCATPVSSNSTRNFHSFLTLALAAESPAIFELLINAGVQTHEMPHLFFGAAKISAKFAQTVADLCQQFTADSYRNVGHMALRAAVVADNVQAARNLVKTGICIDGRFDANASLIEYSQTVDNKEISGLLVDRARALCRQTLIDTALTLAPFDLPILVVYRICCQTVTAKYSVDLAQCGSPTRFDAWQALVGLRTAYRQQKVSRKRRRNN